MEGVMTEQELHDLLSGTLLAPATTSRERGDDVCAALGAGDLTALEGTLRAAGRIAADRDLSLRTVLERWTALLEQAGATNAAAVRGTSYIIQGYVAARGGSEDASLRQTVDSLASRKAELSALHQVNAAANSSLDERAILATVVETVAEVTGADVCSIYLLQPPKALVLAATKGLNPEA